MKRVIAIANEEGRVGKTTTAVNLAASLAANQKRVLLVDMDPRGRATMGSGVDKAAVQWTSCSVLLEEIEIATALVTVDPGGYSLLPSNRDLTVADVHMLAARGQGGESRLRKALQPLRNAFDVILIDSPSALNMLTVNALVAADSVLIPMLCEYYAMEGLSALMETYQQLKSSVNPGLEIEGLLRTMYDPRNNLSGEVSNQLMGYFGDKVYRTIIRRNIKLVEAPSFGKPVLYHDRESRGALDYLDLAGEMIQREQGVYTSTSAGGGAPVMAANGRASDTLPETPPPQTPPPTSKPDAPEVPAVPGRGAQVAAAAPGMVYIGPVLDVDGVSVFQNVGGSFIRHTLADLVAGPPALLQPGTKVKISYAERSWTLAAAP